MCRELSKSTCGGNFVNPLSSSSSSSSSSSPSSSSSSFNYHTKSTYSSLIKARKSLLRYFSGLFKSAEHIWQGSLRQQLPEHLTQVCSFQGAFIVSHMCMIWWYAVHGGQHTYEYCDSSCGNWCCAASNNVICHVLEECIPHRKGERGRISPRGTVVPDYKKCSEQPGWLHNVAQAYNPFPRMLN